jgi:cytochrome c peroxidase
VGNGSFQKFGVYKPFVTKASPQGRFDVTKDPKDRMVFKVPTLRNVQLTAPYLHDGSRWTIAEAVQLMAELQLNATLTPEETAKVVAFLKALTGEQPQVTHPILPPSNENTPKPVRT